MLQTCHFHFRKFTSISSHNTQKLCKRLFPGISNDNEKVTELLRQGTSIIRNFAIIAHIDHGKSTLSDRLLEHAGNLEPTIFDAQSLDTLSVEKQRGITIKARGASMFYQDSNSHILNLIDTPGHVDFSYEVSRSLSACQAVLLLVDCSQGIQAQTIATFELALLRDLVVIPVITKIDLQGADVASKREELCTMFDFEPDDVMLTSSKTGIGIEQLFHEIIDKVPAPTGDQDLPTKALLYDSFWDPHRGVVCLVYVHDGCLRTGDVVNMYHSNRTFTIQECGILMPQLQSVDALNAGQVGYLMANIRSPQLISVGDTIYLSENRKYVSNINVNNKILPIIPKAQVKPFGDVFQTKCMVYACLYPLEAGDFNTLQKTIEKMKLEDGSVTAKPISSDALGAGFRCGFLGILHMEVFQERLEEESGMQVLIAAPTITYKATLKSKNEDEKSKEEIWIESPEDYPKNPALIETFFEPMVRATIICQVDNIEEVAYLCHEYHGEEESIEYIGQQMDRVVYKYKFPFAQIVSDFYSELKSVTHGHGSFDYEECDWQQIDLVKISIVINRKSIGPLSVLCARHRAHSVGRDLCQRLAKTIKRQLFEISIQAVLGHVADDTGNQHAHKIQGKIIAKQKLGAYGRDVLTKHGKTMGTGDISRKKKLINNQKEGKKRMKEIGRVKVPQEAFMQVLKAK